MKLTARRATWFFILSLGLGYLLSPAVLADPPLTLKSFSNQSVHFEVALVKQEEPRDCGLAVLKMIVGFYGQKLDQVQIDFVKENSKAGEGTAAAELMSVFNAADYKTALFQGTLDDEYTGLYLHLNRHHPLIVMITSKDGKDSHYDVVNGYDPVRHYLVLIDPALGQVIVRQKDFEPAWKRANNLTLLAVPKRLLEKTPTPNP